MTHETETKVAIRGSKLSIRFGQSAEDQAEAGEIMSAIREGYLDREAGKPLHTDKEGKPVYRILLHGLHWVSDGKGLGCYRATDGVLGTAKVGSARCTTYREWAVGKDAKNRWGAVLHDGRKGSPHIIASNLRTRGEARIACEQAARRMRWIEGAPW